MSYLGPDGGVLSLPITWTDLAVVDPVVTVAAGRAPFRLVDLLTLCAVLGGAASEDIT